MCGTIEPLKITLTVIAGCAESVNNVAFGFGLFFFNFEHPRYNNIK